MVAWRTHFGIVHDGTNRGRYKVSIVVAPVRRVEGLAHERA